MVTDVAVVHAQPNRLRLRFPSMTRNPEFFAHAAEALRRHPEVVRVVTNALTASLLLEFGEDLGGILKLAEDAGLFHLDPVAAREPAAAAPAPRGGAAQRPALRGTDLANAATALVGGTLLGLAAWQARRGKTLPPSVTLAWYAFDLLRGRRS